MNTEEKAEGQEVKVEELTPTERELIAAKRAQERAEAEQKAAHEAEKEARRKLEREKELKIWKTNIRSGNALIQQTYEKLSELTPEKNIYSIVQKQIKFGYGSEEIITQLIILRTDLDNYKDLNDKIKIVATEHRVYRGSWHSESVGIELQIEGLTQLISGRYYKNAKKVHEIITKEFERRTSQAKLASHKKTALEAGVEFLKNLHPTAQVEITKKGSYRDSYRRRDWKDEEVIILKFPNEVTVTLKPHFSADQPIQFSLHERVYLGKLSEPQNILLLLDTLGALEAPDGPR